MQILLLSLSFSIVRLIEGFLCLFWMPATTAAAWLVEV